MKHGQVSQVVRDLPVPWYLYELCPSGSESRGVCGHSEAIAASGHVPRTVASREAAGVPSGAPRFVQGQSAQEASREESPPSRGVNKDGEGVKRVERSFTGIHPPELTIPLGSSSSFTSENSAQVLRSMSAV